MKLLIAEDNVPMRQMIRRLIEDLADGIRECSDGAEAVTLYTQMQPDWVLLDIEMGQVNGLEAARQIRANFPAARIVIVTNYNDPALRRAATEAGVCGYVLKENLFALRELLQSPAQ